MRLVTIRPADSAASDPGIHRVAVVLPSGRFLALGTLALMMPDRLAEEIEELDLATVIAIDPEFGVLRETMAAAGAKNLEAVAIDPATVRVASPIPRPGKIIGRRLQLPGPHPRAGPGAAGSTGALLDVRQRGGRRRRTGPAPGRHPRPGPGGRAGGRDRAARNPGRGRQRAELRGRLHGRERRDGPRLAGPGESAPPGRDGRRPVASGQGLGHLPAARPCSRHSRRGRRRARSVRPLLA